MTSFQIARKMMKENMPQAFITACIISSVEFEGILDLMNLWYEETDEYEKREIIIDIHDMLKECNSLF